MAKIINNVTASPIEVRDTGIAISANSSYIIPPPDYLIWSTSENVIPSIISGDFVINDGEDDLGKRVGIALIQDNQPVLNEYYTLVQDDDVLVGNGQILYINDNIHSTGNVPDYLDDQIEDDDPTES